MKIDNKITSPLTGELKTDNRTGRAAGARGPAADGPSSENVDVHVSALASHLQEIEGMLKSGEVVDPARIAEIRQAIADGRFQINPDAVAERLLQTVRELLGESGKA